MNNQQTIREDITNRIVASLKNGKVPWRKCGQRIKIAVPPETL